MSSRAVFADRRACLLRQPSPSRQCKDRDIERRKSHSPGSMCIGSGVVGLRDSLASTWFFAVGGGVEERRSMSSCRRVKPLSRVMVGAVSVERTQRNKNVAGWSVEGAIGGGRG